VLGSRCHAGLIGGFLTSAMAGSPMQAPRVELGGLDRTAEVLGTLLARHAGQKTRHARTAI